MERSIHSDRKVRGDDYKVQLSGKVKTYHANMHKKYWEREDNGQSVATCIQELNAVIVKADDEEVDTEIDLYKVEQKETYRDVKISEDLSETQRKELMDLLQEFQDVFTDVPGLTTLGNTP